MKGHSLWGSVMKFEGKRDGDILKVAIERVLVMSTFG
jgi:hypothetical protein